MTTGPRARRPRAIPGAAGLRTAVTVAAAGALLAGCGTDAASDDLPPPGPTPTLRSVEEIRLPLDHYVGTQRDRAVFATATDELVAACMERAGFPGYPVADWSHRTRVPEHAFSGFPPVDLDEASRHGLEPAWVAVLEEGDGAAHEATAAWTSPEARLALHGSEVPLDVEDADDDAAREHEDRGCLGQGRRDLFALVGAEPTDPYWLDTLARRTIAAAAQDPRLAPARDAWSRCMAERGHDYADVGDVRADPRWAAVAGTPAERQVAVDVVECVHESRYADTWVALAAGHQARAIEENAERLEEHLRVRTEVMRRLRERGLGTLGSRGGGPSRADVR